MSLSNLNVVVSSQFKSKMQIQIIRAKSGEPVLYKNVFHAAYVIVKKHGIRGAYQGLPATWLRNIPANSAFFGEFKHTLNERSHSILIYFFVDTFTFLIPYFVTDCSNDDNNKRICMTMDHCSIVQDNQWLRHIPGPQADSS